MKVTLIGDKNVGKSTILLYSEEGGLVFNPDRIGVSIGTEFVSRSVTFGLHNFTMGIWDTTGPELHAGRNFVTAARYLSKSSPQPAVESHSLLGDTYFFKSTRGGIAT